MHRQICQLPMMRRLRAAHYRSLTLAVLASLGACDGDSPVAPTDVPPAPAEEQALVTTAQRILFASYRNGAYDIYRTDPQGSSVVRVTSFSGDESRPAWSPDNKRIAMVRSRMGSDSLKRSDIYLINADGTGKRWARSLPSSFGMGYPSWSPDGSRLVVVVALGGKLYLATMDVATGNMAFVTCENELV
jgi:TolB protein